MFGRRSRLCIHRMDWMDGLYQKILWLGSGKVFPQYKHIYNHRAPYILSPDAYLIGKAKWLWEVWCKLEGVIGKKVGPVWDLQSQTSPDFTSCSIPNSA